MSEEVILKKGVLQGVSKMAANLYRKASAAFLSYHKTQ